MRMVEGYINFSMSYRDMEIVNMAIIDNIKVVGNHIEISGKPVYEFYINFSEDVKKNILKFVRLAYARETFNIIDRIWQQMDKDRAMINYPEWYWANEVSSVKKVIVLKEAKKSLDALELAEKELCLKRISDIRMETVLNLLRAGFKSIWIAYRKFRSLPSEDVQQVRELAKIKNSRELTELQLCMCGILYFQMQNAEFSEVIKMVEA